jgi:hypothetical protein
MTADIALSKSNMSHLRNDPRDDRLTPRRLGKIGLLIREEALRAGECHGQGGLLVSLGTSPIECASRDI